MIKTLAILLTIVFSNSLSGQEIDNPQSVQANEFENEIGISMGSLMYLTHYISRKINYDIKINLFNGIMYKRHFGQNAIRVGLDYYRYHYDYDSFPNYDFRVKFIAGNLRMGYERRLTSGKEQPFVAIDLDVSYGKGSTASDSARIVTYQTDENVSLLEIGMAPAIGVRFQFIRRLSLIVEINVRLYYVRASGDFGHHADLLFTFNPIRMFSFNLHF